MLGWLFPAGAWKDAAERLGLEQTHKNEAYHVDGKKKYREKIRIHGVIDGVKHDGSPDDWSGDSRMRPSSQTDCPGLKTVQSAGRTVL